MLVMKLGNRFLDSLNACECIGVKSHHIMAPFLFPRVGDSYEKFSV